MIGKLALTGTDTASLSVTVASDSYPSRWLFFEPIKGGEAGMAAYNEPVYSSRIEVKIKNSGAEPFIVEHLGKEHSVVAGRTVTLPEVEFKDFRLKVAPKEGHQASVALRLKFDKAYRTTAWKLVSEWSDGP